MERGIVSLNVGDGEVEVWLVSNPTETQDAFDRACATGEYLADSPLDEAADVSKDCVVLQAHWGSDVPSERDAMWLQELLASTRLSDHAEVERLVEEYWTSTEAE